MERVGMHERRERERERAVRRPGQRHLTTRERAMGLGGPWGGRAPGGNYTEEYSERTTTASANPREQPIILDKPVNTVRTAPNRPDTTHQTNDFTFRVHCVRTIGRGHCITACVHPLTQRRRSTERTDVGRPRPRAIHPVVRGVNRKAMAGCQPAVVAARCFWCSRA